GLSRPTAQKYDSYITLMMEGVRQAFWNNPRVEIHQPLTPYTDYTVFGRHFLLTHGDNFLTVGNVSKVVPMEMLANRVNEFNAARTEEERFVVVFVGHNHFGLFVLLDNGTQVFINPSMIGNGAYSQSLGKLTAPKAQWL